MRSSQATQNRAHNVVVHKPFLTEAELAAEIENIAENAIETREEFQKGT